MCSVCGCGHGEIQGGEHGREDHLSHDLGAYRTGHRHGERHRRGLAGLSVPGVSRRRTIRLEQDILAKNNAFAAANRRFFRDHAILALNLVSSPGAGKTSLLVRTIAAFRHPVFVIEGNQQTSTDAERIQATGSPRHPDQYRQGLPS